MRRLLPLLLLAACAEFPPEIDARLAEARAVAPAPDLVPLGAVLAATDALPTEPAFAPDLQARAQALQAQAGTPTPSSAADAERLAALAARAEALRQEGLTEAERERLLSGPAVP